MTTTHLITIALDDTAELSPAQVKDMIHRSVQGSHTVSTIGLDAIGTELEWDRDLEFPLSIEDVEKQLVGDDRLTVILSVDQDEYIEAASFQNTEGAEDHHDFLHKLAFSFGLPYDSTAIIVGVENNGQILVSYTTHIGHALDMGL